MLGLKMETDPRWVKLVEENIEEILTDHAWCEQKAATNAITIIVRHSEHPKLVSELTKIAIEEMEHFGMVVQKIQDRSMLLGPERKDPYVGDLIKYIRRGGSKTQQLVDSLLLAAMIEARSCERFKMLSERIKDEDLKKFYYDLMVSEATHYTTFINFAKSFGKDIEVDQRWKDFLEFEGALMKNYSKKETMHG